MENIPTARLVDIAAWLSFQTSPEFLEYIHEVNGDDLWFFVLQGAKLTSSKNEIVAQPNIVNHYDDILVLFNHDMVIGTYIVSCNPGIYWIKKKCDTSKPVANLVHGVWKFKRAQHKGYNALRQATAIRVWRTSDGDDVIDMPDEYVDEGHFGIDVHAGGTILNKVDKWSAGCTVFYGGRGVGSPYDHFIKIIYGSKESDFVGVWWKASDVARIWQGQAEMKLFGDELWGLNFIDAPTLRIGMGGSHSLIYEWVRRLQRGLRLMLPDLSIDGDFGKKTKQVVHDFQYDANILADGVCGEETWLAIKDRL